MPKRLRTEPIFVAPEISGYLDAHGMPWVIDNRTNTNLNPDNIEDKISIYERQVQEWFLLPATRLLEARNSGFIILMTCLSYIEGIEQYRTGQNSINHSQQFFKNSMNRIFSNSFSENNLSDLYTEARCGLFHNGMTQGKVIINNNFEIPVRFPDFERIEISPSKLLDIIKQDYANYITELKNKLNTVLRNNFNRMFSIR
jgi:hypothetical protein